MKRLLLFLVLLVSVVQAQDFWLVSTGTNQKNSFVYAAETEAVLFDAQLTIYDAQRVIQALNTYVVNDDRTLTYIFVTSDNPASYLGLQTIVNAFPNVTVWASPNVASSIIGKFKTDIALVASWGYPNINNQIPKIESLLGSSFQVGDAQFEVTEYPGVSTSVSSSIWVQSQSTLLAGDLVYNGVFPNLEYTIGTNSYNLWKMTLAGFSSYSPFSVLYPGFGLVANSSNQTTGALNAQSSFLDNFRTAIQAPNNAEQAYQILTSMYPTYLVQSNLRNSLAAALPTSICSLNCAHKTCGDDGCGGCCGVCEEGFNCNFFGQCECAPSCDGTTCGDDGCGGVCDCQTGSCLNGVCSCTPSCPTNSCGSNGCGGVCNCDDGYTCRHGTCVEPELNAIDIAFNFNNLVSFDCSTTACSN